MKRFSILVCILFLTLHVTAQRKCASVDYSNQLLANNPALIQAIKNAEQQVNNTISRNIQIAGRDTSANEVIIIPVVIHLLYKTSVQNISLAQIMSQLDVLNNDFSNNNSDKVNTPTVFKPFATDCRIKFRIAQVDPKGVRTDGIIRKYTATDFFTADDAMKYTARGGDDAWDKTKYLNIWVCPLASRSLGYATPPGGPADRDGIVIAYDVFGTVGNVRAPFNKGRTATHEVGHWLGLKHLWGDTECGSDGVDDTPSQKTYNFGCPSFPMLSSCSPDANGDMFMNYMDFSDDACMNMFTIGQKKRMRALFANGNNRNSILTSFVYDSTLIQGGPVPAPAPVPTPVAESIIVKTYPNPCTNYLVVEIKAERIYVAKTIRIYNLLGSKIFEGQLNSAKSNINISGLPRGNYFIKIGEDKLTNTLMFYKN